MKPTKKQNNLNLRRQKSKSTFNKDATPFSPAVSSQSSSVRNNQHSDPSDLTYNASKSTQQNNFTPNPIIRKSTTAASPTDSNAKPVPYIIIVTNIPIQSTKDDFIQLINSRISTTDDSYTIDQFVAEHDNTITAILKVPDLETCNNMISALNNTHWEGKTLKLTLNIDQNDQLLSTNKHYINNDPSSTYSFGQPSSSSSLSSLSESYWKPPLSRNTSASSTPSALSLSRRTSSLDSRRFDSRSTSKSSISSLGLSSKRSSQSSSISSDPQSNKKPVPTFIMNMIQDNEKLTPDRNHSIEEDVPEENENDVHEHQNHHRQHQQQQQQQDQEDDDENNDDGIDGNENPQLMDDGGDDEFIWVHATDDVTDTTNFPKGENSDNLIKVNARRLFVGNVPYSSNWTSLKNFLINKSNELEPDTNISILRVEIPVHQVPRSEPYYMFPIGRGLASATKSKGFAIVTTGDRHSSEKLIELLNNVEFEGRSLTVRYDKYPEYNNYVMQQMHAHSSGNYHNLSQRNNLHYHDGISLPPNLPYLPQYPTSPSANKHQNQQNMASSLQPVLNYSPSPALLSSLVFERNLYQRNFYYASAAARGAGGNTVGSNQNQGSNQSEGQNQPSNLNLNQSQRAHPISESNVPNALTPGINQFISPPATGSYFQFSPQQQGHQHQSVQQLNQLQGQHAGGLRSLQFIPPPMAPPPPHPSHVHQLLQNPGTESPNAQAFMYWPPPYYNSTPIYAIPPPFHQYQYTGSPHHYQQQFPQQMNHQEQYNSRPQSQHVQQQEQRQSQVSKDSTPTPSRIIRDVTLKEETPLQEQTNTTEVTMSEEEKARDLINSIKDLSIDK